MGVEENCVHFGNEFWDMYNCAFPVAKRRKRKRDVEKRWLNDVDFKELVREKGELYSRKIRRKLRDGEEGRLAEVTKEVNRLRKELKRTYFGERLEGVIGDLRATWGVLGEVLGGKKKGRTGSACGYFVKDGADSRGVP